MTICYEEEKKKQARRHVYKREKKWKAHYNRWRRKPNVDAASAASVWKAGEEKENMK